MRGGQRKSQTRAEQAIRRGGLGQAVTTCHVPVAADNDALNRDVSARILPELDACVLSLSSFSTGPHP
jgi:hypothetical protein